ncbi:MAG: lipopolysaccharide transport periplasmic protein LptA, partial [Gammaproteobacteria bacterium]
MCILLCVPLAIASTEDTKQPITIESDRAVLDERKQISIYTGNVILKQGGVEVKANTITVYAKEGRLHRVVAEGDPVHYQQQQKDSEDIRGVSQRMEYETETNRVQLLGDAELWQGGNRFIGKRIQYDPGQEK